MVFFLTGLVVVIVVRALRKDYARYGQEEGMLDVDDYTDEYGWKQIHADVFRAPTRLTWLSTFYGSGMQLIVTLFFLFVFALLGNFYEERARMLSTFIFLYSITAVVSGHQSGVLYNRYGGKRWMKTMLMSACLLPFLASVVFIITNFFSIAYSSSSAISFGSIVNNYLTAVFHVFYLAFCRFPLVPCWNNFGEKLVWLS